MAKIHTVRRHFRMDEDHRAYEFIHRSQLHERQRLGWVLEGGEIIDKAVGHLLLVSKKLDGKGRAERPQHDWVQQQFQWP